MIGASDWSYANGGAWTSTIGPYNLNDATVFIYLGRYVPTLTKNQVPPYAGTGLNLWLGSKLLKNNWNLQGTMRASYSFSSLERDDLRRAVEFELTLIAQKLLNLKDGFDLCIRGPAQLYEIVDRILVLQVFKIVSPKMPEPINNRRNWPVMKHFGCKINIVRERINPCGYFRCLPSESSPSSHCYACNELPSTSPQTCMRYFTSVMKTSTAARVGTKVVSFKLYVTPSGKVSQGSSPPTRISETALRELTIPN
ncbi:hypothetical protein AG1IA_09451 [Rhizoctonia solani AG-1 IA]|uniref:Uncharacterized protein n=1 Tax=Thanatephorus cucumeris (strain AG1-IA) TaxID=983506 RepID=L8WEA5_THACA|nr:hypothetical protein AG1IA_09451 [Rhizoctonia solani AG-1 IA]